jgi:hypothetical protein
MREQLRVSSALGHVCSLPEPGWTVNTFLTVLRAVILSHKLPEKLSRGSLH